MYDHYIAFDWAQSIVAVARMTGKARKVQVFETAPDIKELKVYLSSLKGRKILTIEESNTSQWLYTSFRKSVDKLVICDPRRNRLLSEGAKTDRIDAAKLVTLLKADLLKPVFHCSDLFIELRRLVSGYEDLVKAGVRLKNQRSALCRSFGLEKKAARMQSPQDQFVLDRIDQMLKVYEQQKSQYEEQFAALRKKHKVIANLSTVPGVGPINSVRIAAIVVDPRRFENKNRFLSYCGLVKLDRISGGRTYGKKVPNFSRAMKCAFKTAAVSTIGNNNSFNSYYDHLLSKGMAEHQAKHAVSRRIATVTYGVLKSGRPFSDSFKVKT